MNLSKWSKLGQAAEAQRRFATHARRMAPGSLGGRTDSASPVSPTAKGIDTPRATTAATGGGLSALLTVRVTASTQALANGWVGEMVTWDETDPGSIGTAVSWDVGDPTVVNINEDGYYSVGAAFGVGIGNPDTEGKVWAMWSEQTRGDPGSWSVGGAYYKWRSNAVQCFGALGSHTLPLLAGDTLVMVIGHEIRTAGGVLQTPVVDGASHLTYMTVAKVA